jgi:hypothetical protein
LALGGTSDEANLVGSCKTCNSDKGKLEQAWCNAGWTADMLTHAAPIAGSLAAYIATGKAAEPYAI